MHPVLILTHNCLEMTKRAVVSAIAQDIPTEIYLRDNGSMDDTVYWAMSAIPAEHISESQGNDGVSDGWNLMLSYVFGKLPSAHALVINNDVVLPTWFYRELLSYDASFVTGVSVDSLDVIKKPRPRSPLVGHPDFSAFLIRREAWEKIGPFDEGMKFYAQDCDYHIRACKAGVPLLAANVPFYHERSSTLKHASEEDAREIQLQANRDRAYFLSKHGFAVGSEEYQRATATVAGTILPFPGEVGR